MTTAKDLQWMRESEAMEDYFRSPGFVARMAELRAREVVIETAKATAAAVLQAQREAKAEAERMYKLACHQVQCMTQGRIKSTTGNRRLAEMLLQAATDARRSA